MAAVIVFQARLQGFGGSLLLLTIHGEGYAVAVGVGFLTKSANHFGAGHLGQVVGVNFGFPGVVAGCNRCVFGKGPGFFTDVAQVFHPAKNPVPANQRPLGVCQRVIGGRCLGQACQHGHLGKREFVNRFVVIHLRCRCDTIGPVTQINLVQVQLEDLFFVQFTFNLKCQQYLVELADEGAVP